MRITLITIQLCVIGFLYTLVALPIMAAVFGLIYGLIAATGLVLTAFAMQIGNVLLHYVMMSLGALPYTTAAPAIVQMATGLYSAAGVLLALGSPWLAAIAANLLCGFLANYRDWHGKARRWGVIVNVLALVFYLGLQGLVAVFAAGEWPGWETAVVLAGVAVVWDSYFVVSILLLRRMPVRPDAAPTLEKLPAVHILLWILFALAGAAALLLVGAPLNWATIAVCIFIALCALPFFYNAKAAKRIAADRKKLYSVLVLLANVALTLVFLVLLPPVGALLLLSTAFIFFSMELALWGSGGSSAPVPEPEAGPV